MTRLGPSYNAANKENQEESESDENTDELLNFLGHRLSTKILETKDCELLESTGMP